MVILSGERITLTFLHIHSSELPVKALGSRPLTKGGAENQE